MKIDRNILLFVLAVGLLGATNGIFETTSNNYFAETFNMTARQRGMLELPREFPGFMVAAMTGVLFFVAEVNLGVLAAGMTALGLFGLAVFANTAGDYTSMVLFLVIWSSGTHLMMPVRRSVALNLARRSSEGEKLGKLASVNSLAVIAGGLVVWIAFGAFGAGFSTGFLLAVATVAGALMTLVLLSRGMPSLQHGPRPKLVLKKKYTLFYVLSLLFGARKQIFITFGPWLLIRVFGQPPQTFAKLRIATHLLIVLLLPRIGRLIDKLGERTILMADAVALLIVCLSYGFGPDLLPTTVAFYLACGAYMLDLFLFPVQLARSTYLSKIAETRRDVGGALGLSVSIDHAVSIPMAMVGGLLWEVFGYQYVFLGAAGIAVLTFLVASRIRTELPDAVAAPSG